MRIFSHVLEIVKAVCATKSIVPVLNTPSIYFLNTLSECTIYVLCEIRYVARENIDTPNARRAHVSSIVVPLKYLVLQRDGESVPRALCATNGSGCIGSGVKH